MYALKRLALAASVAGMLFAAAANADEMLGDGLGDESSALMATMTSRLPWASPVEHFQ
jgi:hypothetical protein